MVHVPVMLEEVLEALQPQDGQTYVDATFGAGGYTRAILKSANCKVVAIDRDKDAKTFSKPIKEDFGDRFDFIKGNFSDIASLIDFKVDGIVADLGVSSLQIDTPERGFSFQVDGALDMRMDANADIPNAADIVNTYCEKDLADLIYKYGGERHSRRIAKAIIENAPFYKTAELASVIGASIPNAGKFKINPATRTFQALRIAVNDELGALDSLLESSVFLLKPQGRLAIVSFHSLEDGAVKAFLRENSGQTSNTNRHEPQLVTNKPVAFNLLKRKAVKPTQDEIARNPRARSARMRWAIRSEVAAK